MFQNLKVILLTFRASFLLRAPENPQPFLILSSSDSPHKGDALPLISLNSDSFRIFVKLYLVPENMATLWVTVQCGPLTSVKNIWENWHFCSWKSPVFNFRSWFLFKIEWNAFSPSAVRLSKGTALVWLGYWSGGEAICFLWHDSPYFARCNYSVPCIQAFLEKRHSNVHY